MKLMYIVVQMVLTWCTGCSKEIRGDKYCLLTVLLVHWWCKISKITVINGFYSHTNLK